MTREEGTVIVAFILTFGLMAARGSLERSAWAQAVPMHPSSQHARTPQKPRTLGEIRAVLLGQDVIITGTKMPGIGGPYRGQDVLLSWHMGKPAKDIDPSNHAPYSLHGTRGTIEAIELAASFLQRRPKKEVDAFGEQLGEDAMEDPYLHVIVRLPDGKYMFTTGFYTTVVGEYGSLVLAAKADRVKSEILQQMEALVGRVIYSVGLLEDIGGRHAAN